MEGIPQVIFNLQIPFDQYKTLCAGNFHSSVQLRAFSPWTPQVFVLPAPY